MVEFGPHRRHDGVHAGGSRVAEPHMSYGAGVTTTEPDRSIDGREEK